VKEICDRITREVKIPVSAGLANSSRLAKLATDAAKPGFLEIKPGEEKEFLKDRSVRELSGIGENRQRALAALGALTFGHVAKMPSPLLKQKFGVWGQQLWLFSNGLWNEPLLLEVKDRTTISSNTTLPYDEPDYEAALTFALSETTRLAGQLRREQLQSRELSLTIRFDDFSEVGGSRRFQHPQFRNSVTNAALEEIFRGIINSQFNKTRVMTGAQLALREMEEEFKNPKAKCPFVPQREMVKKLWCTDADPLAHKGDWEKRLGKVNKQIQFRQ
jgi:DNA polymerase-4